MSSKTASLESKLNLVIKEKTELEALVEQESQKRQALEEQKAKSTASIETMKRSFAEEVDELKRERDFLEASLDSEKCDLSAEKRKNLAIAEQLKVLVYEFVLIRGVDVNKRTATTHSCSLLLGDKIWPLYEQLSIFLIFYWPHLGIY